MMVMVMGLTNCTKPNPEYIVKIEHTPLYLEHGTAEAHLYVDTDRGERFQGSFLKCVSSYSMETGNKKDNGWLRIILVNPYKINILEDIHLYINGRQYGTSLMEDKNGDGLTYEFILRSDNKKQ